MDIERNVYICIEKKINVNIIEGKSDYDAADDNDTAIMYEGV